MAERAIGYYRSPFKGFWGFTHGGPLLPNLLNIVVDAVFRHWMKIVAKEETGPRVFDHTVQQISELFYAHNIIILYKPRKNLLSPLQIIIAVNSLLNQPLNFAKI